MPGPRAPIPPRSCFASSLLCLCSALAAFAHVSAAGDLVINEIYYDPPQKTKPLRFIELYNRSDRELPLGKWSISGAVTFSFPDKATVLGKSYLVVAQDPAALAAEFHVAGLGPLVGRFHTRGDKIELRDEHGSVVDQVTYGVGFPWPTAAGGAGASLELINPSLPRDNPGSWRASGSSVLWEPDAKPEAPSRTPTPGVQNSAFSEQLPPIVDQVAHAPLEPHAGQALTVGARVQAAAGVKSVKLEYQLVEPGAYLRRSDPDYEKGWQTAVMHDDGKEGDARAGDGIFTVVLPPALSVHRRLIRYRVLAEDQTGAKVRVPYTDDDMADFAAFIYNGPPAWSGAIEPGKTPLLTFPAALMQTLPSLTLIANKEDVEHSQWDGGSNKKKVRGTLVADGRVYDNVLFHNRGQGSTFVAGKNKWGFKFDRGHDFDARDEYGRKFARGWDALPMNACSSPWVQSNRGMAGLDEAVSFRLYELAGVPASRFRHVQYRIVDQAAEATPKEQYQGDLWGLYLEVESPDGGFLSTRHLPEGNVYRIAGGEGDRKHQAPDQPDDASDWKAFRDASRAGQPEAWWREHLNLPVFYSFQAINKLAGNVDLREADNHYFYHAPGGHWTVIPWDLDMMFIPKSHQSGRIDQERCLEHAALKLEYKNRCRELLDLLCSDPSPHGGQVGQIVDEIAGVLHPRGFPLAWPELDECLWNYHPRTSDKGAFYRNPTPGAPDNNWTRTLATPDFFGFCHFVIDYCTNTRPGSKWERDDGDARGYGFGYLREEAKDPEIPNTPSIQTAPRALFTRKDARLQCSAYTSPGGNGSFDAMQWRVGEISAPGIPGYVAGAPRRYEIEEVWTSGELNAFAETIQVPPEALRPGATYRARVRMRDHALRWSHWSEPLQFVVLEK